MRSRFKALAFALVYCLQAASIGQGAPQLTRGRTASQDPCLRQRACREHVEAATTLSGIGLLVEALNEYQAAYALQSRPWILFNIARVLDRLGRKDEAAPTYQRFLATNPDPDSDRPGWRVRIWLDSNQRRRPLSRRRHLRRALRSRHC